jgi:flagellar motor switch/type III secretory pathway protein FliN
MVSLDQIGDFEKVPMTLEADLDCGTLSMGALLALKTGSIIRSSRPAGDNIDLRVGGKLVGYGEIIANENMMAVRVTNIKELD